MGYLEAIRKLYDSGKGFIEILESARVSADGLDFDADSISAILDIARRGTIADREVLQRAAIPRWFDRQIYREALATGKSAPLFTKFVARSEVVAASESGRFCITDTARDQLLETWGQEERKRFAASLVTYFRARKDTVNAFVCLLFADPAAAKKEFLRRYRYYDRAFDYVALDDLLCVVRDRQKHIARTLVQSLNEREQYYQSRTIYADDWVKSEEFLERPTLLEEFQKFFQSPKAFLMHLHAPGGAGKTAFLRWLVSRYAIVERGSGAARIPVAKVDIDQVDVTAARRWPWLLLAPVIRQLNLQINGAPLEGLLSLMQPLEALVRRGHREAPSQTGLFATAESVSVTLGSTIYGDMAEQLGKAKCLVIFDTVEELMLHLPVQFVALVSGLGEVRKRCPGLRVLISGRYPADEVKQCSEFVESLPEGQFRAILVEPFSAPESRKYLTKIRGLKDPKLVRKIVLHSTVNKVKRGSEPECSPFKLSLFAELALTPPGLNDSDFRRPELSYLLRRIIDRIPENELALRWTLRYAVIPRQLTEEFFDHVLKQHLEREIAAKTRKADDTGKGLPAGQPNPWKYVEGGQVQRAELWTALRKYAGPRSWVKFVEDIPQLQPEVVQPMRWLLRQNVSMFHQLHTSAVEYFESLAAAPGAEWAHWMVEVIYHRFQRDGVKASAYWTELLEKQPQAFALEARHQLCELLVSGDFVDDRYNPLPDPDTGAELVDAPILARARLELASIFAQRARNAASDQERSRFLEEAVRHFDLLKRLERQLGKKISDGGRRAHIEASIAIHLGHEKKGLAIAERYVAGQPRSAYAVPLLVLQAETGGQNPEMVSSLFERAAALAASQPAPLLSVGEILRRQAVIWIHAGDLRRAVEIAEGIKRRPDRSEELTGSIYETLFDIASDSGDNARLETLYRECPSHPRSFGANACLQIARGSAEYWLSENHPSPSLSSDELVEHTVWRARALGELCRTREAFREIDSVAAELRDSRSDLIELLNLEKAQLALDVLGDRRGARSLLKVRDVRADNRLRHRVLTLRASENPYNARATWQEICGKLLPGVSALERANAWAHWIGYGEPINTDRQEFLHACGKIQPAVARHAVLRAFLYAPVGSKRDRPVMGDFPAPQDGPDLLQHSLELASYYVVSSAFSAAQELLSGLPVESLLTNLVLVFRFLRVARRSRCPLDDHLVTIFQREILEAQDRQPQLAALATLELANWQVRCDRRKDGAKSLTAARQLMAKAGGRFEGRYLPLTRGLISDLENAKAPVSKATVLARGSSPARPAVEAPPGIPMLLPERFLLERRGPRIVTRSVENPNSPAHDWNHQAKILAKKSNLSLYVSEDLAGELLESEFGERRPTLLRREIADLELNAAQQSTVAGWFQEALMGAGYPVQPTRQWKRDDLRALTTAAADLKIPNADWAQWEPKLRLCTARKTSPAVLMFRESYASERSRKRGYAVHGLDIVKELKLPNCLFWRPEYGALSEVDRQFNLFWLIGSLQSTSSGLMLIIHEGSQTFAFTPHQLSETFASKAMRVPPMVFLDIPDDPQRAQQAALRNQFAHSLYSLGRVRSVLGAGLVQRDMKRYVAALRKCIETHACEGTMAEALAPCSTVPVLYSADPTVPVL